jgi:parvulin-like peptidyl-prolyl isomerase
LLVLLAACGRQSQAGSAGGEPISDDDVGQVASVLRGVDAAQQTPCGTIESQTDTADAACERLALGLLVQLRLAEAYAAEHGVTVDDAVVEDVAAQYDERLGRDVLTDALASTGATYDDFRDLLRRSLLQQEVSRQLVIDEVGEDGLRAQYDENPVDHTIVQVDHILVETEQEARDIYDQVTAPGFTRDDFLELAGRVSIDPSATQNSGSLGSTPASALAPEFAEAAVALENGQISEPVQTEFGWHVIRMEDKEVTPFAQDRERLLTDQAGLAFAGWIRDHVEAGDVEVNPRYGRLDPQTLQVVRIASTDPSSAPPTSPPVNAAPPG